ncbi:MAG: glutamine--tRNA ligase/YqeY domain fusion protein [Pseudomonadota bacterium]
MEDKQDFIRNRIRDDLAEQRLVNGVVTRFPPEPNGYLHIGHAKSICLNFGVAAEFGGRTYLRFDDTNPVKEDEAFVDAIAEDVRWLGFDWGDRLTHASDYFPQLYDFAEQLIRDGKAFVCSLSQEEVRATRGTLTEPGTDSPYRDRSVEENLDLFRRMRAGEFEDGAHVLRAKIDMSSPNINMRDPVLYRIRHVAHQRTGDAWCIYPTYDYTHCVCDSLETISHSLCTLEFADHKPLYDWVLENINANYHPPQIEFSRLNIEHTVVSKRFLSQLVESQVVDGWDDPRMPTLAAMRRKGVPAAAIRDFCDRVGVTRQDNTIEIALFDFCVRQQLEASAPRGMAVLEPLKVVLTNYPNPDGEIVSGPWHQQNAALGERELHFGPELYIERGDFEEVPPKKYKRLSPGEMVRLRYGYIIRCDEVIKDDSGEIVELRCEYTPDSKSGADTSGLKPKGVVHWVSAARGVPTRVRVHERLFDAVTPDKDDLTGSLKSNTLTEYAAIVEPAVVASPERRFQFERQGYFARDGREPEIFNRVVSLRDGFKPPA